VPQGQNRSGRAALTDRKILTESATRTIYVTLSALGPRRSGRVCHKAKALSGRVCCKARIWHFAPGRHTEHQPAGAMPGTKLCVALLGLTWPDDREDLISREDLMHLFDANLSREK